MLIRTLISLLQKAFLLPTLISDRCLIISLKLCGRVDDKNLVSSRNSMIFKILI